MFIIEILLLIYFFYFVSYSFFFSVGGLFYKKQKVSTNITEFLRFCVLIPGYKEDSVICKAVKENLAVDYPKDRVDFVVIADSFDESTLTELEKFPIKINVVSFEKSTKVKSLQATVESLPDIYDYIVILDADNVLEKDYLKKVNNFLLINHSKATQTQRWPKNLNTQLALLDGISESINNHIYRQGAHATGFSVSLSGSGMIFERKTFQDNILQIESIGGFDRELEFRLLEQGIKVKYFKEAIVLDQKTDTHGNFKNQRTRWISSQYVYLFRFLSKGFIQLLKGDIVYFHSTVWRNIQLPRLINLGLLSVITLTSLFINNYLHFSYIYWIVLWSINAFSMLIAIPKKLYSTDLFISVIMLPKLFLSMFLILFKLKGANKKFIHTEHKSI